MGIWDVIKGVGATALSVVCPAAVPLIAIANKYLPEEAQLDVNTATGDQLTSARESLPPEAKVEIDRIAASVTIAQEENFTSRYTTQCKADGQSSRAAIARQMSLTLCGVILLFAYGFLSKLLGTDSMTWQVFGLLVGTPAGILLAYFGVLRKEHAQRNGIAPAGLLGMAAGVLGKFK